jgi:cell division protein FtsI/penicillin-binding protein 2
MRPSTGEILALANYSTFDPNRVSESTEAMHRNRAVEVAFEPGSIFKIVAYSAALEEGLIEPNTLIDCGNGELRMPGRVIHDGHYGMLTASQALAKSSNVAAIKMGQLLGNERLAHYIDAFGFWRRTGIELPGESRGVFRPASQWDATSIGSIPMGHEISVTAVQAVAAFACIANGGEWVQPYVVARVTSSAGNVLQEAQRESRRVVSESTAVTLKAMLEGVVARGTGKKAQIGGYRAAGKTGTAQKVDEATRRYSKTRFVASFAGFAPVDSPEIACIVSIDEPRGPHQGGEAAAPVFALVVAEILHMLGVPPEGNLKGHLIASNAFVEAYGSQTTGSAPLRQVGLEHPEWADPPEVASKPSGGIVVPDLTGYGIREVAALCNRLGLQMRASGEGLVETQSPRAGLLVAQNTICHVRFSKTVRKERPRTFAYTSNSASTAPNGQQVRSDRQ